VPLRRALPPLAWSLAWALAAGCSPGPVASRPRPATTSPPSTASAPPATPLADWPVFGHDPGRSALQPGSPPASGLRRAWSVPVPGAVYAQPVVADGKVVVATETDQVLAFDAATGRLAWSRSLGQPVPGSSLPCGDIDPSGITSTPAVDTSSGTVWVVAFVQPHTHLLVGLDLSSGAVLSRRVADPTGSDPVVQQQRGALALDSRQVLIPFGGLYGDCGDYHGFVVAMPETGPGPQTVFQVPSRRQGGIWAPGGATLTSSGDLLVATGNGSSTSAFDGGNAVYRLTVGLLPADYFAPANFAALSASDTDLGSDGPSLVAGGSMVFQVGKEGVGYLLSAAHLGGVGGQLYSARVCQGAYGANAVDASGQLVLVPCQDGLYAVRIGPGPSFRVAWHHPQLAPGPPVLAGGVVWVLDPQAGRLVGLDPATGQVRFSQQVGPATRFSAPAAAGGELLVAAGGRLSAFEGI